MCSGGILQTSLTHPLHISDEVLYTNQQNKCYYNVKDVFDVFCHRDVALCSSLPPPQRGIVITSVKCLKLV